MFMCINVFCTHYQYLIAFNLANVCIRQPFSSPAYMDAIPYRSLNHYPTQLLSSLQPR